MYIYHKELDVEQYIFDKNTYHILHPQIIKKIQWKDSYSTDFVIKGKIKKGALAKLIVPVPTQPKDAIISKKRKLNESKVLRFLK